MPQFSSSTSLQSIAKIREAFLNGGQVNQGAVAEAIERSWRRCIVKGVNEESPQQVEVVTVQDLKLRLEKSKLLLQQAEPEMLTLSEQIAHTRSMVILTDGDGVILRTTGDVIGDDYARASLAPGASWSEEHRGTNAIGTALIERAPISVAGAEHFMAYHHSLSCSAVPIFSANNQLVATLDVSNDLQAPQQHTLALVKMAAQMVENRLFHASSQGEVSIHFHARPEFVGTLWEGVALFDEGGCLQAINRSGQFQFDMQPSESALARRNVWFEDIFALNWTEFTNKFKQVDNMLMPLRLQNGARIYARLSHTQERMERIVVSPTKSTVTRESAASLEMLDSGDPQLALAIKQVKQVINRDIPILIQGETGAGKELFARAIHEASTRKDKAWVAVNCAALPEGLIEAELFGYEEGAYTGAKRKGHTGKLQQADGGTLFLDEIGDMPLSLQARLLRVLQDRNVTPLGSSRSVPVDFVLISATNQKLKEKVSSGEFRSDLYYRINGLSVQLPALRQRTDLPRLIEMILQIEQSLNTQITPEVMAIFEHHPWPGNVRQLHNVLRTAIALADGEAIDVIHLTQDFIDELESASAIETLLVKVDALSLKAYGDEKIRVAMQQCQGNLSAVARQLGISRNTLYRKLKELEP